MMNRKVGLICGGPSLERGISLNSARSVLDHLNPKRFDVIPLYVDQNKQFYKINKSQLYSNTPSDFDFKLKNTDQYKTEQELVIDLKKLDIVFPAIHGEYGETGELQNFLEQHNIPYIGCDSKTCENMYFKNLAAQILKKNDFPVMKQCYLQPNNPESERVISDFFCNNSIKRAIIKPVAGGSSIGVFSVNSINQALEKVNELFELTLFKHNALIEPFCEGREFTVIVLQNKDKEAVALLPSEIEISYDDNEIFNYRRKYLPTSNTAWPTPAKFDDAIIKKIRYLAQKIYNLFNMRHFARLDGWVLSNNEIIFTDFNPISGMEQNSFLFLQASRVGLTHEELLSHIIDVGLEEYA